MKRYSISGIFTSILLVFSIFTLLSISEVNAEEVISVNALSYENTIIIEFENESVSKIKTIRMWLGGEKLFNSFKVEPGWEGGKSPDSKLLVFTATNTLNPGESAKFGLVTDEKVNAINWKALDRNENEGKPDKSIVYLFLPLLLDVIDSVFLTLSLESKTIIDKLTDGGETMLKTALVFSAKFVLSINVTILDVGYLPIPNKVASASSPCFTIAEYVPELNVSCIVNS